MRREEAAGRVGRAAAAGVGLLAALALFAAIFWASIFDYIVSIQVALRPGSQSYKEWVTPSLPIFLDVYFFNWTNAQSFPDEKPRFEQLGPYRFREYRRHVNMSWNSNHTVGYRTLKSWQFEPSLSKGSLLDNVTTLNAIAASAIYRSRDWSFLRQKGLSMGLSMFKQRIFVSKPVQQLLFDGYEDQLLDFAKNLPTSTTGGAPPVDKFGWFYGRNNSVNIDGHLEVTTGADGSLPGQVRRWNYLDRVPYYDGDCGKLYGSAGEFMPRDLTPQSQLEMFLTELCRSVRLQYAGRGMTQGLAYYKYSATDATFDYSPESSSNTCFCAGECAWGGIMNVSACRYGSPAFVSLPHFLLADSRLLDSIEGLEPDPELHLFYVSVEPKLGVPLEVAARFQLNLLVEPSENIGLYNDMPRMLFPVLWLEQHVTIDHRLAKELKFARAVLDWGAILLLCLSFTFAIIAALIFFCIRQPKYVQPTKLMISFDNPNDEAEMKLNPM